MSQDAMPLTQDQNRQQPSDASRRQGPQSTAIQPPDHNTNQGTPHLFAGSLPAQDQQQGPGGIH